MSHEENCPRYQTVHSSQWTLRQENVVPSCRTIDSMRRLILRCEMSSPICVTSHFKHDDLKFRCSGNDNKVSIHSFIHSFIHSADSALCRGVEKAVGCAHNYKAVIFFIKRALTLFVGTAKLFCDHHSSFCETQTLHKRETATY